MRFIIVLIFVVSLGHTSAQLDVLISGTDYTTGGMGNCACATEFSYLDSLNFHDTGNDTASYGANEVEVITFCPDVNGNKVSASFGSGGTGFTFDVHPSDTVFIHDGESVLDPIIDTLNNNLRPNGIITASLYNLSGCLTFRFVSDGADEGTG